MASSHKETTANSSENNNNNMNKGGTGGNNKKNKGNEEKNIPCQYCKKSFVSPAKLRLHVAKCHAVEKSNAIEAARAAAAQQHQQQQADEQQLATATARVFLDEYQLNATLTSAPTKDQLFSIVSHTQLSKDQLLSAQMNKDKVYTSGGDNGGNNAGIVQSLLNSGSSHHQQVVPELELNYVNSSPEDINMDTIHKVGGQGSGGMNNHHINSSLNIPTIHIPEFEPKLGPNEISTEALQALLFN